MSVWPPAPCKLAVPVLMLVTEPSDDLSRTVRCAVDGGVSVIQFRYQTQDYKSFMTLAAEISWSAHPSAKFLINCREEWMGEDVSDGVHLPDADNRPISQVAFDARGDFDRRSREDFIIGQSVHSVERAVECEARGVDYLVAGSVYETTSHPGVMPQGIEFLADVCRAVSIPVIAIGGITPERVGECIAAGAAGVAVLSPIMRAADPKAVAMKYRQALDEAWARARPSGPAS